MGHLEGAISKCWHVEELVNGDISSSENEVFEMRTSEQ